MTKVKIIIAVVAVLSVLGALKFYGDSKKRDGAQTEQAAQKTAVIAAQTNNSKIWNEVRHENRDLSREQRIEKAAQLGILRNSE